MISWVFTSLKKIAKQVAFVLLAVVLWLGLMPPTVQAAPGDSVAEPTEKISPEKLDEMRAQRRKMQSEASKAADKEKEADSLGEVLTDKLNLDEIVEENVLTEGSSASQKPRTSY